MFCTQCGHQVKDGMKFCTQCGHPMTPILNVTEEEAPTVTYEEAVDQVNEGVGVPREPAPSSEAYPGNRQPVQPSFPQNTYGNSNTVNQNQPPYSNYPPVSQSSYPNYPNYSNYPNYQEPVEESKKSKVLPILIVIASVILVGLIVVLILILTGKIGHFRDEESQAVTTHFEEEEEESSRRGTKEETVEAVEAEETEEVVSEVAQESSEAAEVSELSEASTESSSEVPAEATTVTLSCGAEVALDAAAVDLSAYSVTDLTGLEKVTGLTSLVVSQGTLTDLSPLVGLTQLKSLTINNVPVNSISALVTMSSLTYLNIKDTQITAVDVQTLQGVYPNLVIDGYKTSTYQVVKNGVSWENAKTLCENAGGHLATITSQEELDKVTPLLTESGLTYVWLGATSASGSWQWVTGEPWGFTKWYTGEPSGKDTDGTVEDCLCIWYLNNEWTENDQRGNLPDVLGSRTDTLGYLLETEQVSGINPNN